MVIPKPDLTSIPRCECDPNSEAPCSSDTDCLNRMLMYECHPSVCQCGEKCHNQRFQRREYPDCTPFKTEGRGWGLRTNVDIKKVEMPLCYSDALFQCITFWSQSLIYHYKSMGSLKVQEHYLLNTYIYSSEFLFDHNLWDEIVW